MRRTLVIRFIERSDASTVKPGGITLVVGADTASGPVAALGVVSLVVAQRRTWNGSSLAPYIRLTSACNRRPSAGAEVDAHGKVLGIASPRFARFGAIAIPVSL